MQARSEIQFKVGDKAVYPAQGVAEVVNIEEKDIAGNRQKFYVLRILDTDRKIMVPVANASAVGLRQVISEQEIREIFDEVRKDIWPAVESRQLQLPIDKVFAFADIGRSFERMEANQHLGKIVVTL